MNATFGSRGKLQCRKFATWCEQATFRDRVIAEGFKHDARRIRQQFDHRGHAEPTRTARRHAARPVATWPPRRATWTCPRRDNLDARSESRHVTRAAAIHRVARRVVHDARAVSEKRGAWAVSGRGTVKPAKILGGREEFYRGEGDDRGMWAERFRGEGR